MTSPLHTYIGLLICGLFVLWLMKLSGNASQYLDLPAIIFLMGILIGGLWLSFGPKTVCRAFFQTCTGKHPPNRETHNLQLTVLIRARVLAWMAGLLATLISTLAMLAVIHESHTLNNIGRGIFISLLPMLYGGLLAELVFANLYQAHRDRAVN